MNTIGERVRYLRNQKRLSMDALAKSLSIPVREKDTNNILEHKPTTSASISNIENDRHRPSLDMAIALAEFFEVTLDWLILGTGTEPEVTKETVELGSLIQLDLFDDKNIISTKKDPDKVLDKLVVTDALKQYIEAYAQEEIDKQMRELFLNFFKEKLNK